MTIVFADTAWVLISSAFVLFMLPGLDHTYLQEIDYNSTTGTILTHAFIAFQGMFAIITPALPAIQGRS